MKYSDLMSFDGLAPHGDTAIWFCWLLAYSIWIAALMQLCAWLLEKTWAADSVRRRYFIYLFALLMTLVATPLVLQWSTTVQKSPAEMVAANPTVWNETESSTVSQSSVPFAFSTTKQGNASKEDAVMMSPNTGLIKPHDAGAEQVTTAVDWRRIAGWIVAAYGLGVIVMLFRLGSGSLTIWRLRMTATRLTAGPAWHCLESAANGWNLRTPRLYEAVNIVSPMVIGLVRPAILVPTSVLAGITPAQLELIFRHELAHIRRHDAWVQWIQRLSETVLFFNPCIWSISRRISQLREHCCDEIACIEGNAKLDSLNSRYAEALLAVAELSLSNQRPGIVGMAAAGRSPSELRRRVRRVLGEPLEPVGIPSFAIGLAGLLLLGFLWLPAMAESDPLDSLKSLGIPITTISAKDGSEILEDIATSTGGKYYKVLDERALSKIVARENKANRQLIIDSRLLDGMPKLLDAATAEPAVEESTAIVKAWKLEDSLGSAPPNEDAMRGENVLRVVHEWAKENQVANANSSNRFSMIQVDDAYDIEYFQIESNATFVQHMKSWLDKVSGEMGFSDDLLESIKNDPNGPRVDMLKFFEHFGKQVAFVRHKQTDLIEACGWYVDDAKRVREVLSEMHRNDLEVTEIAIVQDIVWIFEPNGQQSSSIALLGDCLLYTWNPKTIRKLKSIAIYSPRRKVSPRVIKQLEKHVQELEEDLKQKRFNYLEGADSWQTVLTAESATAMARGRLLWAQAKWDEAAKSYESALKWFDKTVSRSRKQYQTGVESVQYLNDIIKNRANAKIQWEDCKRRAANAIR